MNCLDHAATQQAGNAARVKLIDYLKAGFHMTISDDRGSQIADRRRSQRELSPYNRGRSRAIAEPTFAYISVSGSVKFIGALC